jgi:hypothetical protein
MVTAPSLPERHGTKDTTMIALSSDNERGTVPSHIDKQQANGTQHTARDFPTVTDSTLGKLAINPTQSNRAVKCPKRIASIANTIADT